MTVSDRAHLSLGSKTEGGRSMEGRMNTLIEMKNQRRTCITHVGKVFVYVRRQDQYV
jgi:hypothetical protein